jgi:hypothetical protein
MADWRLDPAFWQRRIAIAETGFDAVSKSGRQAD